MKAFLKIEVLSTYVDVNEGNNKDTGKPYAFYRQEAYAHMPSIPYPEKIVISLPSANASFAPGVYQTDIMQCLTVGRFGDLAIDTRKLKLEPVQQASQASQPAKAG